ncbi:GNAT family N-acetyltransferase [Microlunatus ginsengisoli]|uniref:GNAT family N-acetyltransferase n=1 Tax=Microlunatus ginsengisoli TaxID=363863 RepID=A0ABP7ATE7_9ACTN
MTVVVTDQPSEGRFEASVDGTYAGAAWYEIKGDVITFTHTVVEPAFEGKGVGGSLARHALDDVRDAGLRVIPRCPFIRRWIERHPDYQDLLFRVD